MGLNGFEPSTRPSSLHKASSDCSTIELQTQRQRPGIEPDSGANLYRKDSNPTPGELLIADRCRSTMNPQLYSYEGE